MAESQIAHGPTLVAGPLPVADRLAAGDVVGDYVVEKFLGAGAMGDVYAGRHPVIGKRVAIKVLKRELAADPEAAERFIREARAVNQIDHPNVIDVFNFGRLPNTDGRLYLVMDLVDGRSLRKALQDGPLSVDAALDVLAKIADALDAAHARGVVHRDLKPDNVMLSDSDPPKLYVLDFGIAKLAHGTTEGGTLTAKGTWLGTPGYMAPEQWSADGAGPASDRYALGVMAYELLSGALPFQAPTLPQMMEQHFRAPVPALSARGKVISHHETLDPVLARAMAKSPDERYATARELAEALRSASGGTAIAGTPRRSSIVPAVAGLGVLGLSVVGYLVIRDGSNSEPRVEPPAASERPIGSPDGLVRIKVVSSPTGATVRRNGEHIGVTPVTVEVRVGEGTDVALAISKPGYRAFVEKLPPLAKDLELRKTLEPITSFEGVWAMPDGQLRGFKRTGDQVDVYKHGTVSGAGELWRQFEFAEPDSEVVFATSALLTDDRAAPSDAGDPSCKISHRIEYHYDPKRETLDVRAEQVETEQQDGRCIVRTRLPGTPVTLVRADRSRGETRWTSPPVGKPVRAVEQKQQDAIQAPADKQPPRAKLRPKLGNTVPRPVDPQRNAPNVRNAPDNGIQPQATQTPPIQPNVDLPTAPQQPPPRPPPQQNKAQRGDSQQANPPQGQAQQQGL